MAFRAPLDDTSAETAQNEITYAWREQGDELTLLRQGDFKRYAYQQCLKICHYMKKVRNKEILSMRAEFLRDDCDNVWFSYAANIRYRECNSRVSWKENTDLDEEQVEAHQKAQQDMLDREMQEYQKHA